MSRALALCSIRVGWCQKICLRGLSLWAAAKRGEIGGSACFVTGLAISGRDHAQLAHHSAGNVAHFDI